MNEGYKKVADIVFGIRIDESTHQVIDGCDISDNKNLYFHKYKIIGTKSFLFQTLEVHGLLQSAKIRIT